MAGYINRSLNAFMFIAAILGGTHLVHAATCTVNTTPVSFGIYWGTTTLASTGTVSVKCSQLRTVVSISLNGGSGFRKSVTNRKMKFGRKTISYNLYTDKAHTQIWGDGTANTIVQKAKVRRRITTTLQIYALLPANQKVKPATYADTVLVTITW